MTARSDGERVEPGPITGMESEIVVERIDANVGRERMDANLCLTL